MQVVHDRQAGPRGGILTLGTFDGVHRGHQALLRVARSRAQALGTFVEVWLYHPHPRQVLRGETVPLLTLLPERLHLLEGQGVAVVRVISFTPEIAALPAEVYVTDWLQDLSAPKELVLGYDHHFGRGRAGDATFLRRYGLQVEEVPPLLEGGQPVSSSRIRRLIQAGAVTEAAQLLGRPYFVEGRVEMGRQVARQLGTPTANLPWPAEKALPPPGVYAGQAHVGKSYPAMLYLSPQGLLEAHLLGWEGPALYGKTLRVDIVAFLRSHQEGLSEKAMQRQIAEDLRQVRAYWGLD